MSIDVDDLVRELRPADAARVADIFPPARRAEMFEAIVGVRSRPPRRRAPRSRLYSFGALVAAAAVATAVLVSTGGSGVHVAPEPAAVAAGVEFKPGTKGDIIAYVTDPYAAARNLSAAFAARGYDITLSMVPVSPSLVGTVVFMGGDDDNLIRTLGGGRCVTGGGTCPIGLDISAHFSGVAQVTLGRAARPGERYESSTDAFAPGEPLHCTALFDGKVADLLPVLAAKHLNVEWTDADDENRRIPAPPASDYVHSAGLVAANLVGVSVGRAPVDPVFVAGDLAHYNAYRARLNAGCPADSRK